MPNNSSFRYRINQQSDVFLREMLIACSICYQIFSDKPSMVCHYLSHVPKNETSQQRQFSCLFCYEVFLDSTSLLCHHLSHLPDNGTSQQRKFGRSLMSVPKDSSSSVLSNPSATQCLKPNASPRPLPNSLQFGGTDLMPSPQWYPSPPNHGTLISQPDVPLNVYPRASQQPSGLPYVFYPEHPGTFASQTTHTQPSILCSSIRPYASRLQHNQYPNLQSTISHGIFTSQPFRSLDVSPSPLASQPAQPSNVHSALIPRASASQPIQTSNFRSHIRTSTCASQPLLGTRRLGLGPRTKPLKKLARKNVASAMPGNTFGNPEEPIDKRIMVDHVYVGGDKIKPNKLDLTLKLGRP